MRKLLVASLNIILLLVIISPMLVTNASGRQHRSQSQSVISSLQQLFSNVSILPNEAFENPRQTDMEKNTLCNKINAIINQIEAGAYDGAVNKLRNDLENMVTKWITSPWKECLLNLIEEIIKLIKGCCCPQHDLTPPVIHGVFYYPSAPEYDDYVAVVAYVTDSKSGVANVTLNYSTDLGENVNLTMDKTEGFYETEIPPQPYNVNVTFLVYAWDKAGNVAVSSTYSYKVGDFHPPAITYIERVPAEPNYNETVLVSVNATEPQFASGVKEVILTYNNGTGWMNTTMSAQEGLYIATIPEFPYGTFVQYRVYAFDNAGNWMAMDVYSYSVQDRFLPVARIDTPTCGSYLTGIVSVEVYVYDDNFAEANLTVNGTVLTSWSEVGYHTYLWNTTTLLDGIYTLNLEAHDQAENIAETECTITVDNTAPTVEIAWPLNGSYVKGMVIVEISAEDVNFDGMELKIDESVHVWNAGGSQTYIWETADYDDGIYTIVLSARDKAGNEAETSMSVTVDNTAPLISNLVWSPLEPMADEQVNVSAEVFEEGSGIQNVTLWFKIGEGEWNGLAMTLQSGNWTGAIPGQEENVTVTFFVECYDNAGNFAATQENTYTVKVEGGGAGAISGFPLNWLLLIIAIIALVIGGTVYYYKYRKKRA
ncbi:MAG: Ig-like domain repeat protein [Candidatus Bathyarchaeota archaeon]|nr:Ig-like domain repeat protein [Candidatus Bathyarchaeota archaeon]